MIRNGIHSSPPLFLLVLYVYQSSVRYVTCNDVTCRNRHRGRCQKQTVYWWPCAPPPCQSGDGWGVTVRTYCWCRAVVAWSRELRRYDISIKISHVDSGVSYGRSAEAYEDVRVVADGVRRSCLCPRLSRTQRRRCDDLHAPTVTMTTILTTRWITHRLYSAP